MGKKNCHVTIALLIVNTLFYILTVLFVPDVWENFGISGLDLTSGEYWRLLTFMFTHGSIYHLSSNMLALYAVGQHLEKRLGGLYFLLAYLFCGFFGEIAALCFNLFIGKYSSSVGASGAIFGLFGIYIVMSLLGFFYRIRPFQLILFMLLNLLNGFSDESVDLTGHITGFITGLLLGLIISGILLLREAPQLSETQEQWNRILGRTDPVVIKNKKKATALFISSGAAFCVLIFFMIRILVF